ncbi:MAG: NB-ARC domain-containing protein [Cyanobacteria bacterium J06634_5]
MTYSDISETRLKQVAKDKRISKGELAALKLALQDFKSKDIAERLNISEAATRKRLGEVYKKFEIKGRGPGKLAHLIRQIAEVAHTHPEDNLATQRPLKSQALSNKLKQHLSFASPTHAQRPEENQRPENQHPENQRPENQLKDLSKPTKYHWNDAPAIHSFQGRQQALSQLSTWINQPADTHKLLAICGIGGIGKTYLARQLAATVGPTFEQVVWITIQSGESPTELLQRLLWALPLDTVVKPNEQRVQQGHKVSVERSIEKSVEKSAGEGSERTAVQIIKHIMHRLSEQRCLVVLDSYENVFKNQHKTKKSIGENGKAHRHTALEGELDSKFTNREHQASAYKKGFDLYKKLLRRLMNTRLSARQTGSCLILTSREKPRELLPFQTEHPNAKLFTLDGFNDNEVKELLSRFYLQGTQADYEELIARYYGHPLALKLAASTVKDIFFGKIRDFLNQEISVFDDLRSVIKSQFKRLPPGEEEVMYWLAINDRACALKDLKRDIVSTDHKRNLIYTLRSLQRRFLVEVEENEGSLFHLHPIVKEYVLDRFIRAIFQDLVRGRLELFNRHALMKADAEEELREFQRSHIVEPVLSRLKNYFKTLQRVEAHLNDRLDEFRETNPHRLGYAGGNFINLMVQLSIGGQKTLENKDFSQMTIWQAYLQGVQLRKVDFSHCALDRSVFTETLSDVMAIALNNIPTHSTIPNSQLSLLACGDANGVVHLWDTQLKGDTRGEKRAEWAAHSSWVRAIAFVPRRPLLVTGGDDNKIRLWQLPTAHQPVSTPPLQVWQRPAKDWINAVAVSPDGGLIVSGGDDKITLYKTSTGQKLKQISGQATQNEQTRIRTLAFSPDSQWLASCGEDCIIRLWAVADLLNLNEEAAVLTARELVSQQHRELVHTLSFTPNSQQLVSGGEDKTIKVWDVDTGVCQTTLEQHRDSVRSLTISEDGRFLASGGDDCQVILWDFHRRKAIQAMPTQQSRIWSVALQQQGGKLLLSAGGDKQRLMLWQVMAKPPAMDKGIEATANNNRPSVRSLRTYRGYTSGIRAVSFLSDDRIVGGGDSGELIAWDTTGHRKATLSLHQGRIWSVAVDRQHARIASASDDHTIRLWDAATGQCLTTLVGHTNWVRTVAFSSHGGILASSGDDCTIRIWNTASGFCLASLNQSTHWIRSVAFDPTTSRYLISGGDEQIVRLWDRKEGRSLKQLAQHEHRIGSVAYSPKRKIVASGSDDQTVIIYDVDTEEKLHTFVNADLGIKAVAFSPDGRYVAAGGDDQLVYVWDLEMPDPGKHCLVLHPQDYTGIAGGIRSVAFSPDGKSVISGGLDEMIRIGHLGSMEHKYQQVMRPVISRDRPYEKIEIEEVKGLSDLQVANLMTLGAVSKKTSLLL